GGRGVGQARGGQHGAAAGRGQRVASGHGGRDDRVGGGRGGAGRAPIVIHEDRGARGRAGGDEGGGDRAAGAGGGAGDGAGDERRVGDGELQGDAVGADTAGAGGGDHGGRVPWEGVSRARGQHPVGVGIGVQPAAARERDGELREGGAARAGEDRLR